MVSRTILCCVAAAIVSTAAVADPMYIPKLHPALTMRQRTELQLTAPKVACGPARSIAFSASELQEGSSGDDSVVSYSNILTNEGSGFINGNTFVAPCNGMYTFDVSFNTDSYYPCPTDIGTQDDVEVYYVKSTPPLYNDTALVGNEYGAWRGQLSADQKRGQASYSIRIRLNAGDAIQTKVHSDGNAFRCLWSANISGNREFK